MATNRTAWQRPPTGIVANRRENERQSGVVRSSSFSFEVPDYASRIDTRIILIDGTEMARLMIAHGVGVTPVAVYELKRVGSDFFARSDRRRVGGWTPGPRSEWKR